MHQAFGCERILTYLEALLVIKKKYMRYLEILVLAFLTLLESFNQSIHTFINYKLYSMKL